MSDAKPSSAGALLRQARVQHNMSVTDLAARTLLRDEVIECLENDDWDALPAMIYVRGYIRLMCRELSLDSMLCCHLEKDEQRYRSFDFIDSSRDLMSRVRFSLPTPKLAWSVLVATLLLGLLGRAVFGSGTGYEYLKDDERIPNRCRQLAEIVLHADENSRLTGKSAETIEAQCHTACCAFAKAGLDL